jgi:hypothetical protein
MDVRGWVGLLSSNHPNATSERRLIELSSEEFARVNLHHEGVSRMSEDIGLHNRSSS